MKDAEAKVSVCKGFTESLCYIVKAEGHSGTDKVAITTILRWLADIVEERGLD